MKKNKFYGSLIIFTLVSLFFTSCGDGFFDEDPDSMSEISYIESTLTPYEHNLFVGDSKTLDWYYQFSGEYQKYLVSKTNKYYLFDITSSDTSVITVKQNGVIKALRKGFATITIKAKNGISSYSSIDIYFSVGTDGDLSSWISKINLEKTRLTVYTDSTENLHYYLYSFDGLNYGGGVYVTSSNTNIFTAKTVSEYAGYVVITPVNEGYGILTVTAKDNPTVSATCTVTVKDSFIQTFSTDKVILNETEITIDKNETYQLLATSCDSNGKFVKDSFTWSSDETGIVTVANGIITGVSQGTAIIKAKSKDNPDKFERCYVTVSNKSFIPVSSISFSSNNITMTRGDRKTISVSVIPSNPSKSLDWSTSSNIISVSPSEENSKTCTITARANGTCTIMAASSDGSVHETCTINVEEPAAGNAKQYFWGTWVRMDKGTEIIVEENVVKANGGEYLILATSTETELKLADSIDGISSITKETKNVMKAKIGDAVIPFYRKGGTNLGYTLKVVGFTETAGRAAGSTAGKQGLKVKGKSNRFTSYDSEGETDQDGNVSLTAPIQGDIQTVTIQVSDTKTITLENLKINNDGSDLGTVPIVEANDPVLKVSGYIEETDTTDGYLYSGKEYIMNIYIKNIGEVTASASVLEILPDDDSIFTLAGISSANGGIPNPGAFTIPTLKPGVTLSRKIKISVNNFAKPFMDTKLNVNILNSTRTWEDYIPLRVYSNKATFTIAASSQMNNTSAALNGFIIYPDGNNQFFTVSHGKDKQVEVPLFKQDDSYILVFSGATTEGSLEETTELFYTVSFNQNKKEFTYDNVSSGDDLQTIMNRGESGTGNETEDTPYHVTKAFEAYITEGDVDFYTIKVEDTTTGDMSELPEKNR